VVLIFVLLSGVVPIERGIASIDLAVSSGLGSEWIPVCGWGNETIVDSDDASPTSSVYRGIQRVYIRLGLMNSLGGMAGCDGWVGSPESNRLTDRSSHSVTLTQHALPKPRVYATRPANQLYRNPQNSSFNPTSLASPPSPPPARTNNPKTPRLRQKGAGNPLPLANTSRSSIHSWPVHPLLAPLPPFLCGSTLTCSGVDVPGQSCCHHASTSN